MDQKKGILEKAPYVSNDEIEVLSFGPKRELSTSIYLYFDVLEELVFNAKERSARGMLLGKLYRYPKVDKTSASVAKEAINLDLQWGGDLKAKRGTQLIPSRSMVCPNQYIEITAFKDIYPTEDALEYGTYLRRQRDFRNSDEILVVGSVCMTPRLHDLVLEDLLFQRTYFAQAYQVALFVSADGENARIFMLDEMTKSFVEVGYQLVCLKESIQGV